MTEAIDITLALFDPEPLRVANESVEVLSPDARRTARQRHLIDTGWHPLMVTAYGFHTISKLHQNAASEVCTPTAAKGRPYTCGSCRFRQTVDHHNRSYPKCTFDVWERDATRLEASPRFSNGAATDVRAWWPGCKDWQGGDQALSPDAARCVEGQAPTDRGDGTVVVIALVAALWTLGLPLAWMIHVWLSR